MTDEFTIRKLAEELKHLYTQLEERKYTAEKPPEIRTMQNTGGKPSMPGNWLWMNRGVDLEQQLRTWAFAAFHDLQIKLKDDEAKIQPLLQKIKLNAFYIAEWNQATNFADILNEQAHKMGKWLNPPGAQEIANTDPYLSMKSLQESLQKRGHTVADGTIWSWASRGVIKTKTRRDNGKTAYSLIDCLNHLEPPK